MRTVKPSILEEELTGMSFSSLGGNMENYIDQDKWYLVVNRERVQNQHFGNVIKPNEDFSFQRPMGVCLGQALYIDPTLFIGRDAEMKDMRDILRTGDVMRKQQRLVLGGMGGIGKTQLAIADAKHHENQYQSVFCLNAASEATIKDSFRVMADLFYDVQDPVVLEGEQSLIHTRRCLSDLKNTQWVLIFDSYDDPDQFKIKTYYPPASHGTIILTTRRPDRVAGTAIRVRPLSNVKESLEILRTQSRRKSLELDPYAKRLAERLAGLPLALVTAGAYLHHSSVTFERYLEEYKRRWNVNPRRPTRLQEYQDCTLYTTWGLLYARLESDDSDAARLLRLLAYFDNQSVWYDFVRAGLCTSSPSWMHDVIADDMRFDGAMGTLADYCFVDVHTAPQSWSMHACVHDWTLAMLNQEIDPGQYCYAFDCVVASIDADDLDRLGCAIYTRLAPNATRLTKNRSHKDNPTCRIEAERLDNALYIARLLKQQVQLTAAEQMYFRALVGYEKALGPDHTLMLTAVMNLRRLYHDQGKLNEAE